MTLLRSEITGFFRRYFDYHRIFFYGKGDVYIRKTARFRLPLHARLTFLFLHSGKDGFCALVSRTKEKGSPFGLPWCGRRDLNPYVGNTRPSNVRVCRFRHSRVDAIYYILYHAKCQALFQKNFQKYLITLNSPLCVKNLFTCLAICGKI